MWLGVVCNLVTHARPERELAPVREFRVELAFEAQEDVPLHAPVICEITRVYSTMRTRIPPKDFVCQ